MVEVKLGPDLLEGMIINKKGVFVQIQYSLFFNTGITVNKKWFPVWKVYKELF